MEAHGVLRRRGSHIFYTMLTVGGEVVSLTHRQAALYFEEDSGYSFLLEAESALGP
jgi:hypothetical protein